MVWSLECVVTVRRKIICGGFRRCLWEGVEAD